MAEGERFQRPTGTVQEQDRFGNFEVGVTHPETDAFVRLRDNGDVEIVATEGLAIVLHKESRGITFIADHIRFLTRDNEGLRWNKVFFNEKAITYHEPTFLTIDHEESFGLYKGADDFIFQPDSVYPQIMVLDPELGVEISYEAYFNKYKKPPKFGGNTVG